MLVLPVVIVVVVGSCALVAVGAIVPAVWGNV